MGESFSKEEIQAMENALRRDSPDRPGQPKKVLPRTKGLKSPEFRCMCSEVIDENKIIGQGCILSQTKAFSKKAFHNISRVMLSNCDMDKVENEEFPFSFIRSRKAQIREAKGSSMPNACKITLWQEFKQFSRQNMLNGFGSVWMRGKNKCPIADPRINEKLLWGKSITRFRKMKRKSSTRHHRPATTWSERHHYRKKYVLKQLETKRQRGLL